MTKMMKEKMQKRIEKAKLAKQKSYERHLNRLKSSTEYRKKDALEEIRFSNKTGSHINCFRGSPREKRGGESDEHIDMKYQVWKQLRKWKHDCIVEPIFENYPGRCDVLDLNTCIIYEVVRSETEKRLAAKDDYYPPLFEIRKVDANKPFNEKMLQ